MGQRATNGPVSGGGGVSRAAICNARVMVAFVLARNCGVKGTLAIYLLFGTGELMTGVGGRRGKLGF